MAYTEKIDIVSPTIMTKSIFTTATNDAKEEQDITNFELPGALLHAKNDKIVIMFMKGKLAELMVQIASQIY